jgi:hypothetical protein
MFLGHTGDAAPAQELGFNYNPPLDVERVFRDACSSGTFLEALCWVSRYFWFLGWDNPAANAASHRYAYIYLAPILAVTLGLCLLPMMFGVV